MAKFSSGVILSSFGFITLASPHAYAQAYSSVQTDQSIPTRPPSQYSQPNQELQRYTQRLLNEHGVLLNQAILAALQNAPQTVVEDGKTRLLQNSHQIATLLASVYGAQTGQSFENLFNQHILIGSQFINAVKTRNERLAAQLSNQAKANGRLIAQFLSSLSPTIPYTTWQHMLDNHVMIEAQQTYAYFSGNQNAATQLRDDSLAQLTEFTALLVNVLQQTENAQSNRSMPY